MDRSIRKWEHVQIALQTGQSGKNGLDDISFVPNSLPNISYVNTKLTTQLDVLELASPIIINGMTGGAVKTTTINQKLAILAKEKGLAMAVGSQMAALRDPALADSYTVVRRENPDGIIFANLGAEASVDQARRVVDMLEANALQIHLNVMQELLMTEGDRDFSGYLEQIAAIASNLSVPVIVKEVGFGMSRQTIRQLAEAGVSIVDVGGAGGTNFARIENKRSAKPLNMFDNWGLTTAQSLLEAGEVDGFRLTYIASGGIRHGLDAAKSLALGASAVGMAGAFLRLVQEESLEDCLRTIDEWHHQLRVAMTALGAATCAELRKVPLTIAGELAVWAKQRGIACHRYARRDL
ncbi:type 2 isopentenyl-diphosphate Delta-isomerase [Brevibacillus fulvus]|uniref:Isopentenyl-diphosphate delta-isomerase n=1 Tax=Brevibacillus fulvus TaxID=1125967 RepID=A0A939BNA3_9BACL|nr:type 2 isopentenyl-diphosphate Delta-isomerase [Brevibacillus fulvus]MBM7588690.1 isopentenyl-diphosphate delta-isomerase [Brevibacillus fulvus]